MLLAVLLSGSTVSHGAAALPATMRAVRSAAPGCGAPDFGCVHVVASVPTPVPLAGEVLLRVNGSSCGVTDVHEAGQHPWSPLGPQRILGYNVAGTVAAVGTGVTRLKLGDPVWTILGGRGMGAGAWAEYVNVSAEGAALFPPTLGVPLGTAATLVGPALTDWFAFAAAGAPWFAFHTATPTAVIVSGSGGTGYVAVQLVKALGITKVVTAATGADTIAWVKSLGADVVVDYKVQEALAAVPDDSIDLVFDNYGAAATPDLAMRKLRVGGIYLSIVNTHFATKPKPGVKQMYFELPDTLGGNEIRKRQALENIAELIATGALKAYVQETFTLEAAPAALAKVAAGGVVSKLAITTAKKSDDESSATRKPPAVDPVEWFACRPGYWPCIFNPRPTWKTTYKMYKSISMQVCNFSGYQDPSSVSK